MHEHIRIHVNINGEMSFNEQTGRPKAVKLCSKQQLLWTFDQSADCLHDLAELLLRLCHTHFADTTLRAAQVVL
jgi:hypothetical protein